MLQFFFDHFSSSLAVFFLSMIPTLESKVAIPFGLSKDIWGAQALSIFSACFWAGLGCFLPSLLVFWLTKVLKKKTSGFLIEKFSSRHKNNIEKLKGKVSALKKCVLISLFVAVPLPLTGAYSGAIIAGICDLKFWQAALSLFGGEALSCLIVALVCAIFENSSLIIFVISLGLVAIFLAFEGILAIFKRQKKKREIELN